MQPIRFFDPLASSVIGIIVTFLMIQVVESFCPEGLMIELFFRVIKILAAMFWLGMFIYHFMELNFHGWLPA